MPLTIRRRKGSRNLYLRGSVRGIAVDESTGTDDPEIADAIRIRREAELLKRSVHGAAATATFLEAAVLYLEAGGEARYLGECDRETGKWSGLIGHFIATPLAAIDQLAADQAARKLYPKGAPATRQRSVYGPLKAVLRYAASCRLCPLPVIEGPRIPKPETRYNEPEQAEALFAVASPKLRRLLIFLTYTGCRLGEAIGLEWEDVALARAVAYVRRTKNGDPRTVHLPERLVIEMANMPGPRTGRVFGYNHKQAVYPRLKRACRLAGIPYISPHQLGRHTFASWLVQYAGANLKEVMEAGGWKSVNAVTRYVHIEPAKAARKADLFPGNFRQKPGSADRKEG